MAVKSKKIRTQGDFDKEMNALQNEVRNIVTPIKQREEVLQIELAELYLKKTELYIAQQQQKQYWANICEMKDMRDEKLKCLAEGRSLKIKITQLWIEINKRKLEMRTLDHKRKEEIQPFHDKMHEMIMKYPKGSLPIIAK